MNNPVLTIRIETSAYLRECATRHGCSQEQLMARLVEKVTSERLVDRVMGQRVGQFVVDATIAAQPDTAPEAASTIDAKSIVEQVRASAKTPVALRPSLQHAQRPTAAKFERKNPVSRTEMYASLQQAVVNTGGRRIGIDERKDMLIERLRARGRITWKELGETQDEQQRWQAAVRALLAEGRICRNDPEPRTRIVYYELCPPTAAEVSSSPASDGPPEPVDAPSTASVSADGRSASTEITTSVETDACASTKRMDA